MIASTELAQVLPLESLDNTLAASGGKAANLGVLLRAGLPVPSGFVITTAAYARIAAGCDDQLVPAELAAIETPGDPRLADLAVRMRSALQFAEIPADLERAIEEAYVALGTDVPVAVRSSATAEDLPTASFAGQQDTYLGIVGRSALLAAVRNCWASLWNERAASYRAANRISTRAVYLAVVVQRMVDAQVAGVLFTANPLTGCRTQSVIDASPGLGEAVVSGAVNPDHFVVDRLSLAITERRLGDKRVAIRQVAGGGTLREERESSDQTACLDDDKLRQLAELGSRVEETFGSPQDIEFAFDPAGSLVLTQSRPITTLFPLPPGPAPAGLRVYFSINVFQGMLQPFTPMGAQAFRWVIAQLAGMAGFPVADPFRGPAMMVTAGERTYVDLTAALRNPVGRRMLRQVMQHMEARSARIIEHLLATRPELALVDKSAGKAIAAILRVMAHLRLPLRIARGLAHPAAAAREASAMLHRQSASDLPTHHDKDPVGAVERVLCEAPKRFLDVAPLAVAGVVAGVIAMALLNDLATAEEFDTVRRALPHNPTTEMDLALWSLARRVQADPQARALFEQASDPGVLATRYRAGDLPPALQEGLAEFLQAFGQRGLAEIDMGTPRWSEDPSYLLGVLASYLRMPDTATAPDAQFSRTAAEAEAMVVELTERARRRGPLRGMLVKFMFKRMRELLGLREGHKFVLVTAFARARRILLSAAEKLVADGRLDTPEDIFFLDLPEVRQARDGLEVRQLVQIRRQAYAAERQRKVVPRVLLSDGTVPTVETAARHGVQGGITGTPASAGIVRGRARIVMEPSHAHLEPGEILVAPSTDPGWTPLFLTAAGLVMEMGGQMSHGAVVAREYGIPAVVGVPLATERVPDGAEIEVDGAAGVVRIITRAPTDS